MWDNLAYQWAYLDLGFNFAGQGGVGKSTSMKHLALSWADGDSPELTKFDFIFHVALKDVKKDVPLEEIIIAQHSGLKANKVQPEEIRSILEGETNSKVLLLLDGHDEYKTGQNPALMRPSKKRACGTAG